VNLIPGAKKTPFWGQTVEAKGQKGTETEGNQMVKPKNNRKMKIAEEGKNGDVTYGDSIWIFGNYIS